MTSRQLTKGQRRALKRILFFYRDRHNSSKVTSIRFKLNVTDYGAVWVTLETRRSDCSRNSPRAVICKNYLHACLGPRGRITVATADNGIGCEEKSHVAKMLHGRIM